MSAGEIAAIIAACAFVLLVGLLAVPILKLGRTLDEATLAIRKAHEGAGPILTNAVTTVEQVNSQLERMDGITANAQSVSSNAAALTSLFASTVGGPLVRVAAFSHGIRKAATNRRKSEITKQAKAAKKRSKKGE
ncbi:MAG TPA: DUF948 domain-containing protein [Mycobacteriales bacterium]|nr:DUF948 domain-containing protein [Mycobacteriales bacterium]